MKKLSFFVLGLIFISLIACTSKKISQKTTSKPIAITELGEYKPQVGKYGGVIRMTTTSAPKSFNNFVAQETSTTAITSFLYEGLTSQDGLTGKIKPALAHSWEYSKDGLTWTFHLRKDVKWFDGKPFTADDVIFTFEKLIFNKEIPNSTRDILTIEDQEITAKKTDQYTVQFKLPVKFAPFLEAMGTSIYPKHSLEKYVKDNTFASALSVSTPPNEIIGTGPFMLEKYVQGQKIILKRNPLYWDKDEAGNQVPYLDGIEFTIVQNTDVELLKFQKGEVDVYGLRGQDYPILKPNEKEGNYTVYNVGPATGSGFLVLNQNPGKSKEGKPFLAPHKLKWFTNTNFRKALSYAIDRDSIINIVMNGLGFYQWGPMSESSGFFYNPKVTEYPFNPEKAKEILKAEGFEDRNGDGVLEDKEGNAVEFNLFTNTGNTVRKDICELIRKDFEDIGVKIHLTLLEFNTLIPKLSDTFDWDAIVIALTGGTEPHFGANIWNSSGSLHMWYPKQEKPATVWEKEIDELFSKGVQELDPDKRKMIYDRWQKIVSDNVPYIYTVQGARIIAFKNEFGNVHPTPIASTGQWSALHNVDKIFKK
ncbi:MAG: ABC transporter substrate-binding protein [Deltaproteobacteria bacterium]|nr:ABC transporter substrate-binding protein [Deltaproteobacteria bacterium]